VTDNHHSASFNVWKRKEPGPPPAHDVETRCKRRFHRIVVPAASIISPRIGTILSSVFPEEHRDFRRGLRHHDAGETP
jgi:hypothetical protein